jgi:glycosyltransferase EpsD
MLRRLASATGDQHVIFTGFLEAPARVSSVLDLYVASPQKEGLPLSLLSAMGAGLAVVAADVPGHREVVIPWGNRAPRPRRGPGSTGRSGGLAAG